MSGKSKAKAEALTPVNPQAQEKPIEEAPAPQEGSITTIEPIPEVEPTITPIPTIEQIYEEVQALKHLALQHTELIAHLQEALARKRKPV